MPSNLFSTTCDINSESYDLCLCIDDDSKEYSSSSTIDDILSKSNADKIVNLIQLQFKSSIDKKKNSNENDNDTIPEMIPLNKLISIKQNGKLLNSSSVSQHSDLSSSEEINKDQEVPLSESTQVDLSYVNISELFLWSVKRLQLRMNPTMARQLCLLLNRCLSKLKNRPRRLLVFINPQCGKSEGYVVYDEKVLPLFEEANINVTTIHTERANHARDYIIEQSLENYDGLISIGGDGMFSEICHGLLRKTAQQAGIDVNDRNMKLITPKLRIGVISAGSTDAVAFGTTGHNDPITNALQIIVGESLSIDIATVHNENGFVDFMATMLAYGFFGNIIQQSDSWRFLGPLRYSLAGFVQFIRNTSYHTELTITQSSDKEKNLDHRSSDSTIKRREIRDENSKQNEKFDSEKSSIQIKRNDRYRTINCLNMPCRCEKSNYGMSPFVHLGDGSFDLILVKHSWHLRFFRFLHQVASDGRSIEQLPNVERIRATEVIIHPIFNQEKELGNWACDGEVFQANEVIVRAHHQALNLFASGIHHDQVKKINKEESNAINTSLWRFLFLFFILLLLCFLYYRFFR